jgi:hypothetical protein
MQHKILAPQIEQKELLAHTETELSLLRAASRYFEEQPTRDCLDGIA